MELLKRLWRPLGLTDMAVGACLFAFTLVLKAFAADPGVGWHLKTGELILRDRAIPRVDPFLASASPRAWVSDQWLADVLQFAVYQFGSWPFLYACFLSIFAVTFLGFFYNRIAELSNAPLASCLAIVAILKLVQVHFVLRPVCLAFPFFCATTVFAFSVSRYAYRDPKKLEQLLSPIKLCLWPLAFVVWCNLHPSFVMGLILLWLIPIAFILDRHLFGDTPAEDRNRRLIKNLTLLALFCTLATVINPYGVNLHLSIAELARSGYFMNLHTEWKSADFKSVEGAFFQIVFFTIAIALFLVGRQKLGWRSFELLAFLIFAHQSLDAVRVFPYFGMISALPLTESIVGLGALSVFNRGKLLKRLQLAFSRISKREGERTNRGGLVLSAGIVACLVLSLTHQVVGPFKGPFGPDPEDYPYGAVEYLKQQGQSLGRAVIVAASPNWGGFITFYGSDKVRTILDDRNTLVGEAFHKEFWSTFSKPRDDQGYFKRFGTDYLLFGAKDAKTAMLEAQKKFALVYKDDVAAVFKYE